MNTRHAFIGMVCMLDAAFYFVVRYQRCSTSCLGLFLKICLIIACRHTVCSGSVCPLPVPVRLFVDSHERTHVCPVLIKCLDAL